MPSSSGVLVSSSYVIEIDAGGLFARDVVRSLKRVASSVRVVEPADGKDARDHLEAGLPLDAFVDV